MDIRTSFLQFVKTTGLSAADQNIAKGVFFDWISQADMKQLDNFTSLDVMDTKALETPQTPIQTHRF